MNELPYNETYAVINISSDYDSAKIEVEIRNPESGTFSSKYSLTSRWYVSSEFESAYGGEITATAYSFGLDALQSASKILKRTFSRLDKLSNKYGHSTNMIDSIIRILQVTQVKEVRIWKPDYVGTTWTSITPLDIKTDLLDIRYNLRELYNWSRNKFPYVKYE